MTSQQRHFHWLFSRFSMWSSSQMDDIDLKTAIFPELDGLRLKWIWYFEGELPDVPAMSKRFLINNEKISGSDIWWRRLIQNSLILVKRKRIHEYRLPLHITILMYIYIYIYVPWQFQKFPTGLFSYMNNNNYCISILILKSVMIITRILLVLWQKR